MNRQWPSLIHEMESEFYRAPAFYQRCVLKNCGQPADGFSGVNDDQEYPRNGWHLKAAASRQAQHNCEGTFAWLGVTMVFSARSVIRCDSDFLRLSRI